MERTVRMVVLAVLVIGLSIPVTLMAQDIGPVVSVDWLEQNLSNPKLVVVDIRKVEEYRSGHIPGAVNVFYNILAPSKGELKNELPGDQDLRDTLGDAGISADSWVVVAGVNDTPADRFSMTRIAMTLAYAGVKNVAVLDGGTTLWAAKGKALSTDVVRPKAVQFKGVFNKAFIVKKDELAQKLGKAVLVDVREPEYFSGAKKLDFVARAGHIKGAVNLPAASLLFTPEGTYKPMDELKALALKAVGENKDAQIVVYCDTGKVATSWWMLLRAFGYMNVGLYDGSSQDWAADPNLPME